MAGMIDDMVRQVASKAEDYASVLIDGPAEKVGKELLLVIVSDRGLCGAYNGNVLRMALNSVRDTDAEVCHRGCGQEGHGLLPIPEDGRRQAAHDR